MRPCLEAVLFPLARDFFYSIIATVKFAAMQARKIRDFLQKSSQVIGSLLNGVLAQLVERLVRNEKVRGSNPLGSTIQQHCKSSLFQHFHWVLFKFLCRCCDPYAFCSTWVVPEKSGNKWQQVK
jgi:hypothetical protein